MIADSHNDIFGKYKSEYKVKKYLSGLQKSNIKKLACVYFSYNNSMDNIINDITKKFTYLDKFDFAVKAIENAWFLTYKNIDKIIMLKPQYVTIVHNESNSLCGGCNSDLGLTQWGREAIKILQENNIIVDTAHMSERAFWEFVDINRLPLFNSHTGIKKFCNHKRNITDEQIKVYRQSEGYIGIALYNEFWGDRLLNSYKIALGTKELIEKYGGGLFGLGTDFNGIDVYPTDIKNYDDLEKISMELNNLNIDKSSIENFMCNNYVNFKLI